MRPRRGFTLLECCVAAWVMGVAVLALAAALAAAHRAQRRAASAAAARSAAIDARERRLVVRRGTSLVELLVALTVGAILLVTMGGVLRATRTAERGAGRDRLAADLADAGELLVRDLRHGLTPRPVGDTALELSRPIGGALSCPSAGPAALPRADGWWQAGPEPGDSAWWHDGVAWQATAVRGVAAGRCADGAPADLLELPSPWSADARVHVRLLRRVRWVAYRDGSGRWSLGFRQRTSVWSAVQPVVGPFDGLRMVVVPGDAWTIRLEGRRGEDVAAVERAVARRNLDPSP